MWEILKQFLDGINTGPFKNLVDLLSMDPAHLVASLVFLGAIVVMNDVIRTALMVQMTRSRVNHILIDIGTLFPGILLGFCLLLAATRHPERAWLNLGIALLLYIGWYIGGTITKFARRDTEAADLGWMSHGMIITMALGLVATVI